jgi:hypothetical protein
LINSATKHVAAASEIEPSSTKSWLGTFARMSHRTAEDTVGAVARLVSEGKGCERYYVLPRQEQAQQFLLAKTISSV